MSHHHQPGPGPLSPSGGQEPVASQAPDQQSVSSQGTGPRPVVRKQRSAIIGAIFLMATSAIGPGFITQTATFTAQLGAAFGFGILVSILIDLAVQMNVWRLITVTGKRAGDLANEALPYSGHVLAVLIVIGGLAFNIGNIAGAGLGMNALLGLDPKWGGVITALLAIGIFLYKKAGPVVDVVVLVLGCLMIVMTLIVAFASKPPVGEALKQTFVPDQINFATITTIVGGTVGGYITYSGAHRFLESGKTGVENVKEVHRASLNGIIVTGVMRFVLFLAILGVVASGVALDVSTKTANPAAQAFQYVLGDTGLRVFGLIFWAAALSSVIGAAYTSATFLNVFNKRLTSGWPLQISTVIFIAFSAMVFLLWGAPPAQILVFVGGFNGLILPIGLTLFMYIGWFRQKDILGGYKYPIWLLIVGSLATLFTWYMAFRAFVPIFSMISGG